MDGFVVTDIVLDIDTDGLSVDNNSTAVDLVWGEGQDRSEGPVGASVQRDWATGVGLWY